MIQLTSTHPLPPPATTPPPPAHPAPAPTATGLAKALDALKAAFPPEPPPMLDLTGLIRSLEKAKLFPPKSQLIPDVTVGQPEPPDRRQAMIHLEVIYQKINVAMKPFYEKYWRFAMAFTAKTLETNCNRMAADLTLELADDEEIVNARNKFDSEVESRAPRWGRVGLVERPTPALAQESAGADSNAGNKRPDVDMDAGRWTQDQCHLYGPEFEGHHRDARRADNIRRNPPDETLDRRPGVARAEAAADQGPPKPPRAARPTLGGRTSPPERADRLWIRVGSSRLPTP